MDSRYNRRPKILTIFFFFFCLCSCLVEIWRSCLPKQAMALELGQSNIRVNSIAPGLFASEITSGLMKREWLDKVAERTVPLRTYGTLNPAMTSIVRYLLHDSSAYVSGNIFIVDAGVTLPGVPLFSSLWWVSSFCCTFLSWLPTSVEEPDQVNLVVLFWKLLLFNQRSWQFHMIAMKNWAAAADFAVIWYIFWNRKIEIYMFSFSFNTRGVICQAVSFVYLFSCLH